MGRVAREPADRCAQRTFRVSLDRTQQGPRRNEDGRARHARCTSLALAGLEELVEHLIELERAFVIAGAVSRDEPIDPFRSPVSGNAARAQCDVAPSVGDAGAADVDITCDAL